MLVATDVAARGLDLPGVELVIHADGAPESADAYAHRAGRAGRPGCSTRGVSLVLTRPGAPSAAATARLERDAKIQLGRLSNIGERVVAERSDAQRRAAWEAAVRRNTLEGDEPSGAGVSPLGTDSRMSVSDAKSVAPFLNDASTSTLTLTSLARLGERSLMDDRFDELSSDLANVRGKRAGSGVGGRGKGKSKGKR